MQRRGLVVGLSIVAVACWIGLVLFMNRKPPDTLNQVWFLLILGTATSCTTIPVATALHLRRSIVSALDGSLAQPIRQGLLVGALCMLLMTLRFMRLLNFLVGVALVLVVVMVETLIYLRRR